MPTVHKILHPTDFSRSSTTAAEYASFLARQFDAELHVLYVLDDSMAKLPEPDVGFPPPGHRCGVDRELSPQLREATGVDPDLTSKLILATRLGPISDQIVAYARDNAIDMIVTGTHGRSGLAHALLGSVAESVVRHASCPVLTVRAA